MREIKFRAWDLDNKKYEYDIAIRPINKIIGIEIYNNEMYPVEFRAIVEQYTGLKDKNGDKEIYEYDIIDGEGNIIGNYHETPELLKDKTNLLIQGFGTKTWLTTYQEAVERGCHDA